MTPTIRVYVKQPDIALLCERTIPNTLEALQSLVGGHIEVIHMFKGLAAIVNAEGLLLGLPFNMLMGGIFIRGPIVFVGVNREDFCDVPYRTPKSMEGAIRSYRHIGSR